ncbi:SpoIIE family protein phosphatase [Streptomyces sp. NPDC048639]|uniref:SpoIIE family protein phosphatase n=1 Tax=Streptomyces sp. NPDC048639 TaxID=3365581 RepID=UPI00371732D2
MNTEDALLHGRESRGGDSARWATFMIGEDGVVTGWSPDAQRLLGHAGREVIGRAATELFVPGADPPFWTPPRDQDDWVGEVTARHASGRLLHLAAQGFRFLPDGSTQREWLVTAALPGNFLLLGEEQAMLDWLYSRSPVAMTVYDTDMRCVRQNEAMARLTGVSEVDRLGKRLPEILSGPDAVVWEQRMRRVLETGEPAYSGEMRGRMPVDPEHDMVLSAAASPLQGRGGRMLGLCATVMDITEQVRSRERLNLLNEASKHIGSTLDVTRTAEELAEMAVPQLADWAHVDLLETLLQGEEPGPFTGGVALRRVANESVNPGAPEALLQPGDVDVYPAQSAPVRCMATGRSVLQLVEDPATQEWLADDPVRTVGFAQSGFQAIMGVPIRARGTTLGVTLFLKRSKVPFSDDDRLLAEELVARAAVCLDNARRFMREHTAALTLQQTLLPQRLPTQTAVDVDSRYLPAGGRSGVGGDWFDVIPLSGRRVALVVGDVVGHGIHAAATMGRLRTAVRTLADVDLPPDELLTHLDDLVIRLATEDELTETQATDLGATCTYAIYDPVSQICSIARAGQPPPAVVHPDGAVEILQLPAGPPLGFGHLPFESAEVILPEGSLLALYTNGLLDYRERGIDEGLDSLRRAFEKPASSLSARCENVLDALLPTRPPADDVALLIARMRSLGSDHVAVLDVPAQPESVGYARSWVTDQLAAWGLEHAAYITELVASELVTNAIRHAQGPIQLRLLRDSTLICEVSDSSNTAPHMRRARLSDEGGRGLLLVAQLTQRWGTRHSREGKTIWCEQLLVEE